MCILVGAGHEDIVVLVVFLWRAALLLEQNFMRSVKTVARNFSIFLPLGEAPKDVSLVDQQKGDRRFWIPVLTVAFPSSTHLLGITIPIVQIVENLKIKRD